MNFLVVPTNRPESLREFLSAWKPWPWDRILVIQDGPEVTIESSDAGVEVFSWSEIDAELPEPRIISRGDSAHPGLRLLEGLAAGRKGDLHAGRRLPPFDGRPGGRSSAEPARDPRLGELGSGGPGPGAPIPEFRRAAAGGRERRASGWGTPMSTPCSPSLTGRAIPESLLTEVRSRVMPSEQYFPHVRDESRGSAGGRLPHVLPADGPATPLTAASMTSGAGSSSNASAGICAARSSADGLWSSTGGRATPSPIWSRRRRGSIRTSGCGSGSTPSSSRAEPSSSACASWEPGCGSVRTAMHTSSAGAGRSSRWCDLFEAPG